MHVPAVFRRLAQHRARPTALLAAGLAAVGAAGLAAAQSGGQDVIHACVSKTGDVRIVDPTTACPKNQTALDWNRQGPPGPQGEPGEAATRLFATADDRGAGNPDVLDESRSTPGVHSSRSVAASTTSAFRARSLAARPWGPSAAAAAASPAST
jgi:hypothetical protein